jgi:hypothetical protein
VVLDVFGEEFFPALFRVGMAPFKVTSNILGLGEGGERGQGQVREREQLWRRGIQESLDRFVGGAVLTEIG